MFARVAVCQHAPMSRRAGLALAVGVTAFAIVTTLVGIASGAPVEFLVLDLVTGLSFVAAGIAAVWLRPLAPTGVALLVSGALWYVGSYGPSGQPVVTPIGFAFERYYDLVLAGLLLTLSSARQRLEPWPVMALLGVAMMVRSFGRLLLLDPTTDCPDCASNPFALWPNNQAFLAIEIATNLAIAVLVAVVAVVVIRRLIGARPVLRRVRWPILIAGGLAMTVAALDAVDEAWFRATDAFLLEMPEPWDTVLGWLPFAVRSLIPIGFLVATLRFRRAAGPLAPFAAGLERPAGTGTVGDGLRTALGDPSLLLLRPAGGGAWISEDGNRMPVETAHHGHTLTLVGPQDRPLAGILHDPVLLEQPELLQGVVRVLRLALENERLEAELREQLAAVTDSRQRIVKAAEDERRRLERDLHDGAQQRLIGVMLALQQARQAADAETVPAPLRDHLDVAVNQTSEAVRELRELARGIHPAILEDEGLPAAVAALARRIGLPVEVSVDLDGRLPRLVESTAYFTIAEALTNTQRHSGASQAAVRMARNGPMLELEVTDDGAGGAQPERGSGLRGLADRVMALGGTLEVESVAGRGTRIRAAIPAPCTSSARSSPTIPLSSARASLAS